MTVPVGPISAWSAVVVLAWLFAVAVVWLLLVAHGRRSKAT